MCWIAGTAAYQAVRALYDFVRFGKGWGWLVREVEIPKISIVVSPRGCEYQVWVMQFDKQRYAPFRELYEGLIMGRLELLNNWIAEHPALVVSVGVPLLTVGVTAMVSYLTTKKNSDTQRQQRKLEHQLKLADFRQAWINDLREDLALYTARMWSAELNDGVEARKEQVMAQARILMRMNPNDPDYNLIQDSLRNPTAFPDEGRKALYQVGQRILKREWDRLKTDLDEIG